MAGHCFRLGLLVCVAQFVLLNGDTHAQGIALDGVGAINRAMGGAGTATAIEPLGSIHWNPASITALKPVELSVGFELLLPSEEAFSRFEANSFGAGTPPVALEGSTRGEPGVTPIPNVALVVAPEGSNFAYGIGLLAVAGFNVNYPASLTNPILSPQPPNGYGYGRVYAQAEVFQLVPTVAWRLNENLSVGVAPTITLARAMSTPAFLSPPNDANNDGFATYGTGVGTRYHWGGGVQAGVYFENEACWQFGASIKSPQWLEPLRFHAENELGQPLIQTVNFDYPLILSFGAAYTGIENTVLAADVRYFDYKNTNGFGDAGFLPSGAVSGLAWNSVCSVSLGAQRLVTDFLAVQAGYWYSENPITSDTIAYNIATPLIAQHGASIGATICLPGDWELNAAYVHIFESTESGPFQSPFGPVPGTTVGSTISADSLILGMSLRL